MRLMKGQRATSLPLPLVGEGWGEGRLRVGERVQRLTRWRRVSLPTIHPSPCPSPLRGEGMRLMNGQRATSPPLPLVGQREGRCVAAGYPPACSLRVEGWGEGR